MTNSNAPILPELFQPMRLGRLNAFDCWIERVTDSPIANDADKTIRSLVHFRVVSDSLELLTQKDLDRESILIDDLRSLCILKKDVISAKYLPGVRRTVLLPEQCWIDPEQKVHVSFILHEEGAQIRTLRSV